MLALRLARGAPPAVHLRRLLVTAASAGTGFLLLCALGHALAHPDAPAGSVLRLVWCGVPLAAAVYFAVAVARTDPGTRPRPGLAAIGLGPGRLMAVSALTTALSTTLGSLLALLYFLLLRGDLTGFPLDGTAPDTLAADHPLPLPAALTLLLLVPLLASLTTALMLRPRGGAPGRAVQSDGLQRKEMGRSAEHPAASARPEVQGPANRRHRNREHSAAARHQDVEHPVGPDHEAPEHVAAPDPEDAEHPAAPQRPKGEHPAAAQHQETRQPGAHGTHADTTAQADIRARAQTRAERGNTGSHALSEALALEASGSYAPAPGTVQESDPYRSTAPRPAPGGLTWGMAVLAAGLAFEMYASRSGPAPGLAIPGSANSPAGVLGGWTLTALGLILAGPGLTHLCALLLQAVRPGALRLLAGRILQEEARRIGRPLGVVCAVASGAYAMATLQSGARLDMGPLTVLGAVLVTGCTLLTLATAAIEARNTRTATVAALLRLGAPAAVLRSAALLRAALLLAVFGSLTWTVAALAATPLAP
ncbi:hypothetical protein [Streptomyces acidicola]|uniref:Uncharacterized protein n=1 Tax=Streptomyces acidicola TaxID=2596892 RepID=A0A5N8WXQ7_9ACTN|nr:hypothetical protein [Streptomyces acidicola]MPY51852.1 hypothetical protein [Streptomyces acidicola]